MALLSSYLVDYVEQNIQVFSSADGIHTGACVAAVAGAVAGAAISAVALRMRASYRNYDPDEHGLHWCGMKKTLLVFVAFILLVPVAEFARLFEERFLFSSFAWNALAQEPSEMYSSWWGGAIIFSSAVRGMAVVLACALVALVLLRRRSVRWMVPLYVAMGLIAGAVQNFLYVQIFVENGEAIRQQHFDRVAGLFTLLLIIVPYLWVSKRVHATFRL